MSIREVYIPISLQSLSPLLKLVFTETDSKKVSSLQCRFPALLISLKTRKIFDSAEADFHIRYR